MPYPCFMLEDAGVSARWLRRFTYGAREQEPPGASLPLAACPGQPLIQQGSDQSYGGFRSGHDAATRIEDTPTEYTDWEETASGRKRRFVKADRLDWPHEDRRWPIICEKCDYRFKETDTWQLFGLHLYYGLGRLMSVHPNKELLGDLAAPAGAMWWADWFSDDECGPEGLGALCVITPGGMWNIDGFSRDGNGNRGPKWSRSGVPPMISVTPSILIGDPPLYHSFLTNGVLGDG